MARRIPVVMVHGAFCGGWSFTNWRRAYEAYGFAVHTPDLRHHAPGGDATHLLGETSIRDYCADLCALLENLDSPPVIVGHSLGGLLAQMLATKGGVRALILLAPLPPWGMFPSTPFEWMVTQTLCWQGALWKKVLQPKPAIAEAHAVELVPEEERAAILRRLVPESGRAMFEAMCWMLDTQKTTVVDRRHVTCPVLCLSGGRDRIASPPTVRSIARRYGGRARYELLADHGHWLIGEQGWERIARGSLTWLDQVLDLDARTVSR